MDKRDHMTTEEARESSIPLEPSMGLGGGKLLIQYGSIGKWSKAGNVWTVVAQPS